MHIGLDLALEGVYDCKLTTGSRPNSNWRTDSSTLFLISLFDSAYGKYDHVEYFGIWAITIVMTVWGMTAALIAGVIAALTTYAVQSINYQSPIRQIMKASTLRSSAWTRSNKSREILEDESTGRARILVFQLQGHVSVASFSFLSLCHEV